MFNGLSHGQFCKVLRSKMTMAMLPWSFFTFFIPILTIAVLPWSFFTFLILILSMAKADLNGLKLLKDLSNTRKQVPF
ncbi:hypothetical protein [Camelliibacillus cellulosilyticus]|uniref:hypothetical protein n=1 Tax=Camelliibacillus cellulosilyticus TaxID=2174486 RepID=UPI00366FAB1B